MLFTFLARYMYKNYESFFLLCLQMTSINYGNYFTYFNKTITPEREIFQGMFDTIVNLTPCRKGDHLCFEIYPKVSITLQLMDHSNSFK